MMDLPNNLHQILQSVFTAVKQVHYEKKKTEELPDQLYKDLLQECVLTSLKEQENQCIQMINFVFSGGGVGVIDSTNLIYRVLQVVSNASQRLAKAKQCSGDNSTFISQLLELFITNYKQINSRVHFRAFILLCGVLNINPESQMINLGDSCVLKKMKHKDRLLCLHHLLRVVQRYPILVQTAAEDIKPLVWLSHLTDWLLTVQQERCDTWFMCLEDIMSISSLLVDAKLSSLWKAAWLQTQQLDEDTKEAQNRFLLGLLDTFAKLRKLPRLVEKLLALLEEEKPTSCCLPDKFIIRFEYEVGNLPITQILEIWNLFLDYLTKNSGIESADISGQLEVFSVVCKLLSMTLSAANVGSLPVSHSALVFEFMTKLATDVLSPHLTLGMSCRLGSILLICRCWAQVHQILSIYPHVDYHPNFNCPEQGGGGTDSAAMIANLHPYLTHSQWNEVINDITTSTDVTLHWHYCHLIGSSLRWRLTRSECQQSKDGLKEIVDELTRFLRLDGGYDITWNWQLEAVTEENSTVAFWQCLTVYLDCLLPIASSPQLQTVTDSVIRAIVEGRTVQTEDMTVYSEAIKVIGHLRASSRTGLSSLVSSLYQYVTRQFKETKRKSIGKQTSSSSLRKAAKTLSSVSESCDVMSPDGKLGQLSDDVTSALSSAGEQLCQFLSDPEWAQHIPSLPVSTLAKIIQVIEDLPLHCLSTADLLRTSILPLYILILNGRSDDSHTINQSDNSPLSVVTRCYHFLEGCVQRFKYRPSHLLVFVKPEVLLIWTTRHMVQVLKQVDSKDILEHQNLMKVWRDIMQSLLKTMKDDQWTNMTACIDEMGCLDSKWGELDYVVWQTLQLQILQNLRFLRSRKKSSVGNSVAVYQKLYKSLLHRLRKVLKTGGAYTLLGELDWAKAECLTGDIRCFTLLGSARRVFIDKNSELVEKWNTLLQPMLQLALQLVKRSEFADLVSVCLSLISFAYNKQLKSQVELDLDVGTAVWSIITELTRVPMAGCYRFSTLDTTDQLPHNVSKNKELLQSQPKHKIIWHEGIVLFNLAKMLESKFGLRSSVPVGYEEATDSLGKLTEMILSSVDENKFKELISTAITNKPNESSSQREISGWLYLWQIILSCNLDEHKSYILGSYMQMVLMIVSSLLISPPAEVDTVSIILSILDLEVTILNHKTLQLHSQHISLCLHSVVSVPVTSRTTSRIAQSAMIVSLCNVLGSMLLKYGPVIISTIPTFLGVLHKVVRALARVGEQSRLTSAARALVCAHELVRVLTLLGSYREEICRVAPYLIATYVTESQRITLYPKVKEAVLLGIYRMLDVCDVHGVKLLRTTLSDSGREVFNGIYETYSKFYRYTGSV